MNIKRQYHSSNCTLSLEGLAQEIGQTNSLNGQPVLSIIFNAECRFISSGQTLSGGKAFFDNLTQGVNSYAQQFLSGLVHPYQVNSESDLISLEPQGNYHRLIWEKKGENQRESQEILLSTVQLFDLVETIDQFYQDQNTLPEFSLPLEAVSRRHALRKGKSGETSLAVSIGITSLALAALAFFLMPIPEIRRPETPEPAVTPSETIPSPQTTE